MDIQEQEVDEEDITVYNPREYRADEDVYANPELVRRAIGLLRQAQRPLVVASGPATHRGSGSYLEKFIETTRLPLMTEEHARGLVSDDHPYCYGFFDQGLNQAARLLREADVVVLLGRKQDYSIRYAQPPTIAAGRVHYPDRPLGCRNRSQPWGGCGHRRRHRQRGRPDD